jgi:hypothetical protein
MLRIASLPGLYQIHRAPAPASPVALSTGAITGANL